MIDVAIAGQRDVSLPVFAGDRGRICRARARRDVWLGPHTTPDIRVRNSRNVCNRVQKMLKVRV